MKKGDTLVLEDGFEYLLSDTFIYDSKTYFYFVRIDNTSVVFAKMEGELIIINNQEELRNLIAFYVKSLKLN